MRADPVFLDRTGQRRRLFKVAIAGAAVLLATATLVLVAGFTGTGPGHLPTLPQPAGGEVRGAGSSAKPTVTGAAPAPRPTAPGPVVRSTTSPAPRATSSPTATPTPSRSSHRRVPTHTPGNKPTKRA
jgi:hypothetical protein